MGTVTASSAADTSGLQHSLANLKLERDAVQLYDGLAALEKDPVRADAFRAIASSERRHAFVWASKVQAQGADVPPMERPRWRVRAVLTLARLFGTRSVSGMVKALEGDELALYEGLDGPEMEAIAADEREHAAIWKRLDMGMPGVEPSSPEAAAAAEIALRDESWHRAAGNSGTLFTPDYRGVMVLSAYTYTEIDGFRWAVMAEIDRDEVLQSMAGKRPLIAGLLFLLYAMALWSLWYIRAGEGSGDERYADIIADSDYPDMGG